MPIFKYTVANKEGKKLNGTVETENELTARNELNNLGFSILELSQLQEQSPAASTMETAETAKRFVFEAVDKNSKLITGTIPSLNEEEAFKRLQTEYSLTVSAIWPKNATNEQITEAKKQGTAALREKLKLPESSESISTEKSPKEEKEEEFLKAKIENILKEVGVLLQEFDKEFDPNQKAEINKKIDKLLRIKHSTNLNYILETANELLEFIQTQEKYLQEKGYQEKQLQLHIKTQKLLDELNQEEHKKSISEDILGKIQRWQNTHIISGQEPSTSTKFLNSILTKIKKLFETPSEITTIKAQIKAYNKQLFAFIKLYFKEPTTEYKEKVKQSIKTIWKARKKAKENLKEVRRMLKMQKREGRVEENLMQAFTEELNAFTGWLLAFYIIYYFVSLYLNTKDFGLTKIPAGFIVYQSEIFKYALVIIFLLHTATALKLNFFKKSITASIIIPPTFLLLTIVALLNL